MNNEESPLIVTKGGVPMEDQAAGLEAFKAACAAPLPAPPVFTVPELEPSEADITAAELYDPDLKKYRGKSTTLRAACNCLSRQLCDMTGQANVVAQEARLLNERAERLQKEFDEMVRERDAARTENAGLRKRIHQIEQHNRYFFRCESAWCNPSAGQYGNPALDDLKAWMERAVNAEADFVSGTRLHKLLSDQVDIWRAKWDKGREEGLREAARSLVLLRDPNHESELSGQSGGIAHFFTATTLKKAEDAILALLPSTEGAGR